ncbi:MAG: trypsin-like serine protease [Marinicella sp.]
MRYFLCFICICLSSFEVFSIESGREALENKWNYAVSIIDEDSNMFCSGTLLTVDVVLTAAHCVNEDSNYLISNNDSVARAKPLFINKYFTSEFRTIFGSTNQYDWLYDVALLKLDREIKTVQRPSLMSSNQYLEVLLGKFPSKKTQLLGYGKSTSQKLGKRKLYYGDNLSLSTILSPGVFLQSDNFHSGAARQGDSGSALQVMKDGELIVAGVTSFGTALKSDGIIQLEVSYFNEFNLDKDDIAVSAFAPIVPTLCMANEEVQSSINFDGSSCGQVRKILGLLRDDYLDISFTTLLLEMHLSKSPENVPNYSKFAINVLRMKSFLAGMPITEDLIGFFSKREIDYNFSSEQLMKLRELTPLIGSKLIDNGILKQDHFSQITWKYRRNQLTHNLISSAFGKAGAYTGTFPSGRNNKGFLDRNTYNLLLNITKDSNSIGTFAASYSKYCHEDFCLNVDSAISYDSSKWIEGLNSEKAMKIEVDAIQFVDLEDIICSFAMNKPDWKKLESIMVNSGSIKDFISYGENDIETFLVNKSAEDKPGNFSFIRFPNNGFRITLIVQKTIDDFQKAYSEIFNDNGIYLSSNTGSNNLTSFWESGMSARIKFNRSIYLNLKELKNESYFEFDYNSIVLDNTKQSKDQLSSNIFGCVQ